MKSTVIRTAIASSVIAAVLVSALGLWAVPRIVNPPSALAQYQDQEGVTRPWHQTVPSMKPSAAGQAPTAANASGQDATPAYNQTAYATYQNNQIVRDAYGEPIRRHRRTSEQSALIVAGSAGTGAAIGAIAGGGKGAAIGAISGGAAGFIYDRLTANK
jgi:hypothetical protein